MSIIHSGALEEIMRRKHDAMVDDLGLERTLAILRRLVEKPPPDSGLWTRATYRMHYLGEIHRLELESLAGA